jgi:hypothetical protein
MSKSSFRKCRRLRSNPRNEILSAVIQGRGNPTVGNAVPGVPPLLAIAECHRGHSLQQGGRSIGRCPPAMQSIRNCPRNGSLKLLRCRCLGMAPKSHKKRKKKRRQGGRGAPQEAPLFTRCGIVKTLPQAPRHSDQTSPTRKRGENVENPCWRCGLVSLS